MVFLRSKLNASTTANDTLQKTLPEAVRPGDYCLLWIATGIQAAVVSTPSYLSELAFTTSSPNSRYCLYGGFVPSSPPPGFNVSVTGGGYSCWSASFWGGVSVDEPATDFAINSASGGDTTITRQRIPRAVLDALAVWTGPLHGKVAATGGPWTTYGGVNSDDFVYGVPPSNSLYAGAYRVQGDGTYDDVERFAVCGPDLTRQEVSCSFFMDWSASAVRAYEMYVLGRWVDQYTYVSAGVQWLTGSTGAPANQVAILRAYEKAFTPGGMPYRNQIYYADLTWSNATGNAMNGARRYTSAFVGLTIEADGAVTLAVTPPVAGTQIINATIPQCASGGSLSSGKVGIRDNPAGTVSVDDRRYFSNFNANGFPDYPITLVDASFLSDANTTTFSSTPKANNEVDEVTAGPLGDTTGRGVHQRYIPFSAPPTAPVSVTATDNLESGGASYLSLGRVFLHPADKSQYASPLPSPSIRIVSKPESWEYALHDTATFARIMALKTASDRKVSWVHNKGGQASFSIDMREEAATKIEEASTSLAVYRAGEIVWSGPIWSVNESAASSRMTVSAASWQALMEKRIVGYDDARSVKFGLADAGVVAAHLLALTNAQKVLPIWVGRVQGSQERKRAYQRYQSIGQELLALADIESGYDIWIDPQTRELTIWARLEEDNTSTAAFGFNAGVLNNLKDVSRSSSADKLVNGIYVTTKNAATSPTQQIDRASVDRYGLFQEQASLGEVTDANVAIAYAAGELMFRARPLKAYTLSPNDDAPVPLVDYHVGSIVKFSANHGSLKVSEQKARVFELALSIGRDGRASVDNLTIANS